MTLSPEEAEAKRAADFAPRKARGDEILNRSRARHHAELNERVNKYFRDVYGDEWREVMEERRQ